MADIRSPYEPDGFYKPGVFGDNSLTKFFNATYGVLTGLGVYGPGVVIPEIPVRGGIALDTRTNLDGSPVDPSTYLQRSEEHTSELQSLMRISYAVFCLKKKKKNNNKTLITLKTQMHNNAKHVISTTTTM